MSAPTPREPPGKAKHPLHGAWLKVVRAHEHLESLNREVGRYINAKPYKVAADPGPDGIRIQGVVTDEPPPPLACIAGDFLTNCRASLDYIAWELVKEAITKARRTLSDAEERSVSFPIVDPSSGKAGFAKKNGTAYHLQHTCGVPAAAIRVIEQVQPYHARYDALATLKLLVGTDKHRALLLCTVFMESAGRFAVYRGDTLLHKVSGVKSVSYKLATLGPRAFGRSALRVEVEDDPTLLVALKDIPSPSQAAPVKVLDDVFKCLARVVPRFYRFFP